MPDRCQHCPPDPDAAADAYLLGRMTPEEAYRFEEHYLGCPPCSERLQFTKDFVAAYRRATDRLRNTAPLTRAAGN